jgi:SPP1 family predicted phage head-tail adaptor
MFTPGELDHLITIQREVLADDGIGGQDVTLSNVVVDLWCKKRVLSGKELDRYDQLNAMSMCAFVIRYRDDLRPDDRIISDGMSYNIRHIPPVTGRSMYLVIEAETGVAL